jgi:hypothetical protein
MNATGSKPSIATVRELAQRWSNWGRWGPEDQLGTLNHGTCRVAAAGLVWDGLAHVFFEQQMYNGYSAAYVSSGGARRNAGRARHLRARSGGRLCA